VSRFIPEDEYGSKVLMLLLGWFGRTVKQPQAVAWSAWLGRWVFGRGPLLAGWWFPKLHLVSFGIDHPTEFAEFGLFDLLVNLHAFRAQRRKQGRQIVHAVVDHERRRAGSKVLRVCCEEAPGGCSLTIRVIWPFPLERGATPFLYINPEMLLVPRAERLWVYGLKEDSADTVTRFMAVFVLARLNNEVLRGLASSSSATPAESELGHEFSVGSHLKARKRKG
jgi:hypothetical protein